MGKSVRRIYDSISNVHILPQSGNVGTQESTGEPVIFDPSSMFGHNEAE
jgi:fructosamine-3-kinase